MEGKLNVTFMLLISHAFLLAFAAGAMDQSGVEWRQVQGLPSQQIKLGKAENIAKADSAGKLGPSEDILVVKLNWAVSRLDTAMTIDEMQLYSELSLEIAQNLKVVKDIAMDLANLKQAINIAKLDFAEKLGPSEDILVVKLNWAVSRLDAAGTVDQMHLYNKLSLQIGQTLKIVKELGLDL